MSDNGAAIPEAEPASHESGRGPWGPFLTLALTLVVGVGFLLAQVAVAIPYLGLSLKEWSASALQQAGAALGGDGFFLGLSELVSGATALGLTLFFITLRRGPRIKEYLAVHVVRLRTILLWILLTFLLGVGLEISSYVTAHDSVPAWMLEIFASAGSMPLLLFAVAVVAPVAEEVVFRGFLLEGLRHSLLGGAGAVVVAALLWASIHLQYEPFYVGQVFVVGLLLGAARLRTGSIVVPIAMHCFFNSVSVAQLLSQMS
jgi:CAAX protease family protein